LYRICRGPDSAIPEPAIPFAWAPAVYTTDRMIYVTDTMNHRVVAVKPGAEQEAVCAIDPGSGD
jgi:hypothetical protein